jgi:hypothetical protein
MADEPKQQREQSNLGAARLRRPTGFRPIGTWRRRCGYCGQTTQVVTDGRMLLCSGCGH